MWIVTLILILVAAYFLWDALRDFKFLKSGNALSSARRESAGTVTGTHAEAQSANYKNTHPASSDTAPSDTTSSDTATDGSPSGVRAGSESAAQQRQAGGHSAGVAAAAAAGATAVGAAALATRTASGKLKFLDAPNGPKDDLCRIDGIGPVVETGLNDMGVFHYNQIAGFSQSDIDNVNAELDFPGRIEREKWVDQAQRLVVSQDDGQSAASSAVAGSAVAGAAAGLASRSGGAMDDTTRLTDADLTGAWNTDVLIEVQERLKVLNTRESDSPRLQMTKDEYKAIKDGDESVFSRERLMEILERLRYLS